MDDAEFRVKLKLNEDRAGEEYSKFFTELTRKVEAERKVRDLEIQLARARQDLERLTKQEAQPISSAQVQAIVDKACQRLKVEIFDIINKVYGG